VVRFPTGFSHRHQARPCSFIERVKIRILNPLLLVAAAALLQTLSPGAPGPQTPREVPPAFGPYVNPKASDFAGAKSFTNKDRLVGTYYFYWYCADTKEHILNGDGSDALTDHTAPGTKLCYHSVAWHKKELSDMIAAGIDVVLPVFWGSPAEHVTNTTSHWSFAGLPPLVQAREQLLRAGKRPPRIGLFYDTSTLQWNAWNYHADLTTDFGKRFFYGTVRDFFSCIPPKHWAMIDRKPIVLLYASAFAAKWDQTFVDFTKLEFAREFGGRVPWIAPQDAWRVKGDATCAWGGALGLRNPGIGELGPGYDHSAVPGRTPLIVKREAGKFYEEQWLRFLRRPSNFVMLETWNELHEGTDLCESREYGRQYIELTRKYADLFRRGWIPPRPKGAYNDAKSVSVTLGERDAERGLKLVPAEDGQTAPATRDGREARAIQRVPNFNPYVYFAVDESFKSGGAMQATAEVEYCDTATGMLTLEFDGSDLSAPFNGAYSRSGEVVQLTGDQRWKTARFTLRDARFLNSQNGGADFRLAVGAAEFAVRRVVLTR